MSISKFRDTIVNSGCGKVFVGLIAGAMLLATGYQCSRASQASQMMGSDGKPQVALGDVAGVPISPEEFEEAFKQQSSQFGGDISMLPPQYIVTVYAGALGQAVDSAAIYALAKKEGIDFSEQAILKSFDEQIGTEMKNFKQSLIMQGKLKANATDADLEDFFKKQNGKTLKEAIAEARKKLTDDLSDKTKKLGTEYKLSRALLVAKLKTGLNPTEDDVKKSFEQLEYKQILLRSTGAAGENLDEKAKKVVADLASGMRFEDAIDKYSNDLPPAGKKLRDATNKIGPNMAKMDPDLTPLLSLKPGSVSEPVKVRSGMAIYKLAGVVSDLPKDFEKNKGLYRDGFINQEIQKRLNDMLKKFQEQQQPRFALKGFEALYGYGQIFKDQASMANPKAVETKMRAVADIAKPVATGPSGAQDHKIAVMVYYATIGNIYQSSSNKAAVTDEYIAASLAMLEDSQSANIALELADLYKGKKDNKSAADMLVKALQVNQSFEMSGERLFSDIAAKAEIFKKEGVLTGEPLKNFEKEQMRWREEKKRQDEEKKKVEAQQAEDKKRAAEAEKANKPTPDPKAPTPGK